MYKKFQVIPICGFGRPKLGRFMNLKIKSLFGDKQTSDVPDDMKYLIVGLGNIGPEYHNTRHNIGFNVIDAICESKNIIMKSARYADQAEFKFKGRKIILIKPTTYMNLSGKAINYWLQKEKIPLQNLLVIVDDIALPFGTIRIKAKGSDAGHNGLANINQVLGHQNYARLRFGIGDNFHKGKQIDYVLGKWSPEEKEKLEERIAMMEEAVESFISIGTERTMNFFNGK